MLYYFTTINLPVMGCTSSSFDLINDERYLIEIQKACRSRNDKRLLKLLRCRENFNLNQHINGFYPVHWATAKSTRLKPKQSDNSSCIAILDAFGADLNKRSVDHDGNNLLPIQLACYDDQVEIFAYLLSRKHVKRYLRLNGDQSIFMKYVNEKRTPLIYAIYKELNDEKNTSDKNKRKK